MQPRPPRVDIEAAGAHEGDRARHPAFFERSLRRPSVGLRPKYTLTVSEPAAPRAAAAPSSQPVGPVA